MGEPTEKYIQSRMLKAILDNNGKATSREIHQATGMKMSVISRCGDWLKFKDLVKRTLTKFGEEGIPRRIHFYELRDYRMDGIMFIINKMPEGWTACEQ